MSKALGAKLKKLRKAQGLTLREFCLANEIDPVEYSKLERGRVEPLADEELLGKLPLICTLERDKLDALIAKIRTA